MRRPESYCRVLEAAMHAGKADVDDDRLAGIAARRHRLAALSVQGYRQAQDRARDAGRGVRRRLLQLVLKRPVVSRSVIADLAHSAGWTVPEQCAMVALDVEPTGQLQPDPVLGPDVLAD